MDPKENTLEELMFLDASSRDEIDNFTDFDQFCSDLDLDASSFWYIFVL